MSKGDVPYRESKLVGVNDRGNRVGEDHPRAKLTNDEIDLIRELREPTDGAAPLSFGEIAAKFEISKGTVFDIVRCRRRAQYAVSFRRVRIVAPGCSLTIKKG